MYRYVRIRRRARTYTCLFVHAPAAQNTERERKLLAMANSMESLLESAKTYVDVLRSCNSDEVSSWKIDDLERAVNWAEYFKRVRSTDNNVTYVPMQSSIPYVLQVQGRIRKNPALVRKFDADLKRIGYQARLRFGGQELTSEFLGSSSDYLFTVGVY